SKELKNPSWFFKFFTSWTVTTFIESVSKLARLFYFLYCHTYSQFFEFCSRASVPSYNDRITAHVLALGGILALTFNRRTEVEFCTSVDTKPFSPPIANTMLAICGIFDHCFSCPSLFNVSVSSSGLLVPISNFFLFVNSSCKPLSPETLNAVPFPKSPSRKPHPPYSVSGEYCLTNDFVKLSQV